jgi:hypothetical protein
MTTYDFQTQLTKGKEFEQLLDLRFSTAFQISPATPDEQRHGIDRHYVDRRTKHSFTVEYKADNTAKVSGNAFVETVSVDTAHKLGWAYTSQAQYLFYLVLGDEILYIFTFAKLRRMLARWIVSYPQRTIRNKGYNTVGVLVPLVEFERNALLADSL